jgi:tetratricopeptide (TPR) repeat protein
LGALLYEALGGPTTKSPDASLPPLRQFNRRVSVGLSDIIQKCLHDRPAFRYREAADLASDLRRHLSNLSLRGVPNRSVTERWRKWRRRRPAALSRSLILLVVAASVLLAAGSLGLSYRQRLRDIDAALSHGQTALARREFTEAGDALRRGLSLADHLPGTARQRAMLAGELAVTRKSQKVDELHRLAEMIRFRYGLALPPPEEARSLIQLGRALWDERDHLMEPLAKPDEPGSDDQTRRDLLDLIVLWADLRVRFAPAGEAVPAKQDALRILTAAANLLGTYPALERLRRAYGLELGLENAPAAPPFQAGSAWEHFDLGKSYLRSGDIVLAAGAFHSGLALRPQDFWLNFYDGLCAYRLKHFEDAVSAFRVSIALAPQAAECHYNRGLAYQALGRLDLALADYDRALKLNRDFTDAALNRGMIHYRLGDHDAARADLKRALTSAQGQQARGTIHYNLALVELAAGNRKSCAANVQAALELGYPDAEELSHRLDR